MKKILMIGLLAITLAGCDERNQPADTECHDYRIMTFYDNGQPPLTYTYWHSPKTHVVCVLGEKKIENVPN